MARTDIAAILREQREHHSARAPEYDDAYRRTGRYDRGLESNASWRADLAEVSVAFDELPLTGDVVELAAGTGFWTERLVAHARSLTVIDGSEEMLVANRQRLGSRCSPIDYQVADLFEWQPRRAWDACVFGFWLCHVPDERVAGFLRAVASSLRTDGVVCFVDKAPVADTTGEHDLRTLTDGRSFAVIDHPRRPSELVDLFGAAGMRIEVEMIGSRFCLGRGRKS